MSALKRYFLLVARTLPVQMADRLHTSQERDFHHDIRQKLLDTDGQITVADEFLNAVMLNSDSEPLLLQKRNAFALHRLYPHGPGWIMKGGDARWRERAVENIQAGTMRTPQDLDLI